ncbi:caffeoylshikimate esterase isoform X2 [Hevea brasiliensis]|uniref:caffeoylshikimate esterase isoform X2 n=1 Tax=Hevea brasiliensis TaxID=3981 RepID=UPI000B77867E|nr:caffeoylshikimate esterase isoform X2 [Hevea brasiliensis]
MEEQENLLTETVIHYWGKTREEEYYKQQGIRASHSLYTSPRGLSLFTRSWLPISTAPPRGILCMVHGYGNDISWTFQSTAIFLAQMGFACYAIDIEGHGRSQGLKAYVPNVDLVVQDCLSFFNFIKQDPEFHGLPSFLYDVLSKSIKVEEKKIIGVMNPMRYKGKPRLGTVLELLRVTDYLSQRLCDISIPFIVLHGSADVVTDPNVSRALYEEANSEDKTIKIYDGMMHSLLFGETDENIEIVRGDILAWLNDRCQAN